LVGEERSAPNVGMPGDGALDGNKVRWELELEVEPGELGVVDLSVARATKVLPSRNLWEPGRCIFKATSQGAAAATSAAGARSVAAASPFSTRAVTLNRMAVRAPPVRWVVRGGCLLS
jgi:hypothetical protein